MTEDALLELVRQSIAIHAEGVSVVEIADAVSRCETSIRKDLGRLIRQGKAELAGKAKRQAIDGSMRWVPVYREVRQ